MSCSHSSFDATQARPFHVFTTDQPPPVYDEAAAVAAAAAFQLGEKKKKKETVGSRNRGLWLYGAHRIQYLTEPGNMVVLSRAIRVYTIEGSLPWVSRRCTREECA